MMKKIIFSMIVLITAAHLSAQAPTVYKASLFGCMSDGVTLNTNSIQTAINALHEKGGGELHFYVGRYLTGTVHLKSNVTLVLHEGATLVGVPSIYDYDRPGDPQSTVSASVAVSRGLIVAKGQRRIGIIGALAETPSAPPAKEPEIKGMGIIQGGGVKVRKVMEAQRQKGYLEADNDPTAPALISLVDCEDVRVEGIMLLESAGDVQVYRNCKNVSIVNQLVNSKETPDSDGVEHGGCNGIKIRNNFFEVSGRPIRASNRSTGVIAKDNQTR